MHTKWGIISIKISVEIWVHYRLLGCYSWKHLAALEVQIECYFLIPYLRYSVVLNKKHVIPQLRQISSREHNLFLLQNQQNLTMASGGSFSNCTCFRGCRTARPGASWINRDHNHHRRHASIQRILSPSKSCCPQDRRLHIQVYMYRYNVVYRYTEKDIAHNVEPSGMESVDSIDRWQTSLLLDGNSYLNRECAQKYRTYLGRDEEYTENQNATDCTLQGSSRNCLVNDISYI